ncbi:hypothetical protein E4H12_13810 [Candidatus Thorarchaeota archaeon]|nr:MAG: hypothetical protein E4H12_13810 [Candidatus Thorarchaeota archaeon]
MNLDRIRHLFEYHLKLNRTFWDYCVENLQWEQFLQETGISVDTIRNQFVHMMSVEERWFQGFEGPPNPGTDDPLLYDTPEKIREKWDTVEAEIRRILKDFTDEDLERTYHQNMKVWHVLSHVVNHGTAHRAQIGAMLRGFGFKPPPQDYIYYVLGRI